MPAYPAFDTRQRTNENAEYYDNLTPEITATVAAALTAKGYEVVDLRATMQDWSPPCSAVAMPPPSAAGHVPS